MQTHNKLTHNPTRLIAILFILLALALAACNGAANDTGVEPAAGEEMEGSEHEEEMEDEHEGDMEGMEHDEDMDHEHEEMERIDNAGATIQILSPADGSQFSGDADVVVEVEVANFTLGEEGNHWHIYIDGASWGMVTGQATSQVLRGIDSGEHELAVYLAGGDHIELAEGDAIMITIAE